jgi:serine/threonine protein kinase
MQNSIRGAPEDCPSEEELLAFARAQLESAAAEIVAQHVQGCGNCRQAIAALRERHNTETRILQATEDDKSHATKSLIQDSPEDDWNEDRFDLRVFAPTLRDGALGRLGKYDVLSILGSGGMGVVFKAFDDELRRPVALKVLNRELSSSTTARRRFVREARAAAAVNHPNVVTIFGVETHNDLPFIVMECVSGISLREQLRRQRLEPLEALRVSAQIATGLAAAHAHGVIHRDIKPANILLEEGLSRVKITDFGLARAAVDNVELTSRHRALGTPAYMSPEQVRGETIDARSDLFSLGCVMHAMFTGHSPFQGRTALESSRRVVDELPPPLETAAQNAPRFLAEIVSRLLEKQPDRRFQSAQEVATLLDGYVRTINQTATDELPDILGQRLRSRPRHGMRRAWVAASLALVVMIVGLSVWLGVARLWPHSVPSDVHPHSTTWLRGEISVSKSGPARCASIAEALELAGPGARIVVLDDSEYAEPLVLDRTLQWQGITLESESGPTLVAPEAPSVVRIAGVPAVVLRGFKIRAAADQFGIEIGGECAGARIERVRGVRVGEPDGTRNGVALAFLYIHNGATGAADTPIVIKDVDVRQGGIGFQIGDELPRDGEYLPVKWVRVEECTVIGPAVGIGYQLILANALEHVVVTRSTFAKGACGVSFFVKQPHLARDVTVSHNTFHDLTSWMVWHDTPLEQDAIRFQMNLIARTPRAIFEQRDLGSVRTWFVDNGWLPSEAQPDPILTQVAQVVPHISFASEDAAHDDYLRPQPGSWDVIPPGTELPGRFGVPLDGNRKP